ncbi:MAG: ribosome biogenesis GTP-binding protein YihA/YsxC [Candidatus Competibacterales bacterium]
MAMGRDTDKRGQRYQRVQFVTSARELDQLPADGGREVAFVGRSNAGKSSALNAITRQSNLARTSKTPGRTQLFNVFQVVPGRYLIDLPGYGYARVPESIKRHWYKTLPRYFTRRKSLCGLFLLMDSRHPLTEADWEFLQGHRQPKAPGLPIHVLLTKADKLGRGAAAKALAGVRRELALVDPAISVQLFSSPQGLGLETAWGMLDRWLGLEAPGVDPAAPGDGCGRTPPPDAESPSGCTPGSS